MVIFDDLALFVAHILCNHALAPEKQEIGELIETFAFVGSDRDHAPDVDV